MSNDDFVLVSDKIRDTSEAPKGKDVYYRCGTCGGVVPSMPRVTGGCACGNIFIDLEVWRLSIDDYRKFEVVKKIR